MRLIDADKFKDGFNTDTAIGKTMRLIIDEQKSAYDVDKVIEQLENAKTNFIGMSTIQSAYFDKGIDKAIEVVKSGGVAND